MTDATFQTVLAGAFGLGGAIIGSGITLFTTWTSNKTQESIADQQKLKDERAALNAMVIKMIELAMEYPYLEREDFSTTYPNCVGHTHGKERYENYCCFVFNMIGLIFEHFKGDRKQIEDYYHVREAIRRHHKWWLHDKDNLEYAATLRSYIQILIDELRKSGSIKS